MRGKENETGSTNSFPAAAVAIPTALLLILEEVDVERIRDIVEPMRLKYVPSGPNGARRRLQHHWIRHLNETKAEFAYGIEVFGYYRKSFTRKILWKVQELPDLPIRIEGGGGEIGMYSRLQFFSLCHYRLLLLLRVSLTKSFTRSVQCSCRKHIRDSAEFSPQIVGLVVVQLAFFVL